MKDHFNDLDEETHSLEKKNKEELPEKDEKLQSKETHTAVVTSNKKAVEARAWIKSYVDRMDDTSMTLLKVLI
jgi:hypothetical protein